MKKKLGIFILTFLSSNVFAIQLEESDYGYKIGNNKYFQRDGYEFYLSDNGVLKKINIDFGMLLQIFKLKNEYIVTSVISQYNGSPMISSIGHDLKVKEIDIDLSNVPDYLRDGSFHCNFFEKNNNLYSDCSSSFYEKNIYKFRYKNGVFMSINKIDNSKVRNKHCLKEYEIYKELRSTKPKYGYRDQNMSMAITRDLYSRLKNMSDTKYAQILNSKNKLTFQQFKVTYCP